MKCNSDMSLCEKIGTAVLWGFLIFVVMGENPPIPERTERISKPMQQVLPFNDIRP